MSRVEEIKQTILAEVNHNTASLVALVLDELVLEVECLQIEKNIEIISKIKGKTNELQKR